MVAAIPRTAERPMEATVITARVTRMAIMAMAAVREVLMEEVSAAAAIVVAVGTAAAGEVMGYGKPGFENPDFVAWGRTMA